MATIPTPHWATRKPFFFFFSPYHKLPSTRIQDGRTQIVDHKLSTGCWERVLASLVYQHTHTHTHANTHARTHMHTHTNNAHVECDSRAVVAAMMWDASHANLTEKSLVGESPGMKCGYFLKSSTNTCKEKQKETYLFIFVKNVNHKTMGGKKNNFFNTNKLNWNNKGKKKEEAIYGYMASETCCHHMGYYFYL